MKSPGWRPFNTNECRSHSRIRRCMGTAVLFDTANLICETWRCCRTGKCCWFCVSCRSGGIGRRAWFRSTYSQGCGGSSPFFGTKKSIFRPYWNCLLSRMLGLLAERRQRGAPSPRPGRSHSSLGSADLPSSRIALICSRWFRSCAAMCRARSTTRIFPLSA